MSWTERSGFFLIMDKSNKGVVRVGMVLRNFRCAPVRRGGLFSCPPLFLTLGFLYAASAAGYQLSPNPNHGTITIAPADSADTGVQFENYGTISNSGAWDNNANLYNYLNAAISNQVGGTLQVDAYIFNYGSVVNSGHIDNSYVFYLYSGASLTNQASGVFNNDYSLNVGVNSTVGNAGMFETSGLGDLKNDGTITNSGTFNNASGFFLNNGFGTINNESGATLQNDGTINSYGTINNTGTVYNTVFLNNQDVGIFNNNTGALLQNDDYLNNHGTMNNTGTVVNNLRLYNDRTLTNNAGGLITNKDEFDNGATSTATVNNFGRIENESVLTNDNEFSNREGGVLANKAGGKIVNNFDLYNYGTLDNAGTLDNTVRLTNYASGVLINEDGGTIQNDSVITNTGAIRNAGTFIVSSGRTMTGAGTYEQTAGETYIYGQLAAAAVDISGGLLTGGNIQGALTIGTGATVTPLGTLKLDGSLTFNGGNLLIEIAKTNYFDQFSVSDQATFNGGLITFRFLGTYLPTIGDKFTFFVAGGGISGFDTLDLAISGLGNGWAYDVNNLGNSLQLSLLPATVPLPASGVLLSFGLAGLGFMRRLSGVTQLAEYKSVTFPPVAARRFPAPRIFL